MGSLRRYLRVWAANHRGNYKQKKVAIQEKNIDMDVTIETIDLTVAEHDLLTQSRDQLVNLLREEEIKYYQRIRAKDILLADCNTRYFQMVSNGKKIKKTTFSLDHDQGKMEGQENLKHYYITCFYNELFGPLEVNDFILEESWISDIPQINSIENVFLTTPFIEKEVREAIFEMEHNKTPGLDGFLAKFYQHFWDIIKEDLMLTFRDIS
jgi:hypothetical protein